MLRVQTLGLSEIHLDDRVVSPEHTATFLLLLLTALRAPRSIGRLELAELLWSEAPAAARNHRLRSLLHRTRQAGVALECTETAVHLADRVVVDFREFATAPRTPDDVRRLAPSVGAILPGVEGPAGSAIAARLDDEREVIRATVIRWVSAALGIAKAASDWPLVAQVARAGRVVDPFNEEAWHSLAEAQRLTSGRMRARHTLEDYAAEVGELDERDPVARRIMSAIDEARRGRGSALVVWGPRGSGRTALLHTVESAPLPSARTVFYSVHDGARTSWVLGLVRQLLEVRGAAGCDPAAYATLRRAVRSAPNADLGIQLSNSSAELLAAIGDEQTTLILVDDACFADAEEQSFWNRVLEMCRATRIVWVFACLASDESELRNLPRRDLLNTIALWQAEVTMTM